MSSRRAVLVVSPEKPEAKQAAQRIRALLNEFDALVEERVADNAVIEDAPDADLLIVIGGDGTLLSQARRFAHWQTPLLGVNVGRLGYLSEFDEYSLTRQANAILGGASPLVIAERRFLSATVHAGATSAVVEAGVALNDCVIAAGPPFRMIEVSLSLNGELGPTIRGDGVIVSSPIGSTGHNASAGGPIVSPELACMIITPIAAHTLASRPFVAPAASVVEIHLERANESEAGQGTTLVLDGQVHHRLREDDTVRVTVSDSVARMVCNPDSGYWSVLVRKLGWAAPPLNC